MNTKQTEALKLALKKAFDLGKTYWEQADSERPSQWKKADVTQASFNQLVEDTIRETLADHIVDANKMAEQPAQQEPVALDHIACIENGKLRYITGRKAPAYDCELYAMPDGKNAPKLYASPPAQRKPWGGLSDYERTHLCLCYGADPKAIIKATEDLLRKRNA